MPVEWQGITILPVVRQFCCTTGNGMVASVTPLALFIIKGQEIWFVALEDEVCGPEELVAAITPGNDV